MADVVIICYVFYFLIFGLRKIPGLVTFYEDDKNDMISEKKKKIKSRHLNKIT